jgi:PAS domain S-box-containing protein
MDRAGQLLWTSRAFAEMVGWEPAELVGLRPPYPYWPEDDHARRSGILQVDVAGGEDRLLEVTMQRRGGERFRAELRSSALRDATGAVIGRVATFQDTTERDSLRDLSGRYEAELRRLRLAVEASGEVVFLTDPDGTIQYVNPEFTRLYGWTADEVVGKVTPRILKSGTLAPEQYVAFWQTLLAGSVLRGEIVNRTKDGRVLRMESTSNPIVDDAGAVVGFLAIQRDVTERHNLTEQLVQAQKMEAVGRLAGGVAHDFNNLLSAILNYTAFVMDELGPNDPLRADLDEVRRAGERAASLTRQLLLLSRREKARPEILDLNSVVANMEKLLRRTIGEDIALVFEPGDELPPVKADPGHLEQILMNLAVNARDAMPTGGRIRVETSRRTVTASAEADTSTLPAGSYVVLQFTDTGCGMPPEVAARAFDPFFTTKPAGKGTGLGLSIVYGIVNTMGGAVAVTSQVGQGTTLTFHFPATEETRASALPSERTRPGRGETILVVEDEPAVRQITRRMLVMSGYRVLEASNAGEALLIGERHQGDIDIVLTDIVMPYLSGVEGARRLVVQRPTLKVVFMSGYSDTYDPVELEALGAQFLSKPFTRDQLLVAVETALGRH